MSDPADATAAIARLKRQLARERTARLEAEAIAERITADHWELDQRLESKLARRTAELNAARQTAAEALAEQTRVLSQLSHHLRTTLTALLFLSESLSAEEPLGAQRVGELKKLISDMHAVLDDAASSSSRTRTEIKPQRPEDISTRPSMTSKAIMAAFEAGWHEAAARCGKLLLIDIDTRSDTTYVGSAEEVNQAVLDLIRTRSQAPDPVIELHLVVGADSVTVT